MLKLLVTGICGKMGSAVCKNAAGRGAAVVCGVDVNAATLSVPVYTSFGQVAEEVDAIIDFSSPAAIYEELEWANARHIPAVIAATGYSETDLKYIKARSKENALLMSSNFSPGIALLKKLVREAAGILKSFDIEIVEKHHRGKADAPSGTAVALAECAGKASGGKRYICGRNGKRGDEIGIHAVRGGTFAGEHEVIFAGGEEIITLSHTALSKDVFAAGATEAAKWLCGKPPALYGTDDLYGGVRAISAG